MSEEYFQELMLPDLRQIYNIDIKSASGSKIRMELHFVVCKNLSRPFIWE